MRAHSCRFDMRVMIGAQSTAFPRVIAVHGPPVNRRL
jgi:hypothetical protein